MALTGYSIKFQKELDVEQFLRQQLGQGESFDITQLLSISDDIRKIIREDIVCPCCFTTLPEVVNASKSGAGKAIRQAYFRFVIPGHHRFCDFADLSDQRGSPENIVSFGEANNEITRKVRRLVCSAIEIGIVDQTKIRSMREWFFKRKTESLFYIDVPEDLPNRLKEWQKELNFGYSFIIPLEVNLSNELTKLPAFNWRQEAKRQFYKSNAEFVAAIENKSLRMLHFLADRTSSLLKRFNQNEACDIQTLEPQYNKSIVLARFISDYLELKDRTKFHLWESRFSYLLAFSALLLFVNDWDMSKALVDFSRIAQIENPDESLGNVIGLNPFHDYEAWSLLKSLNQLPEEFKNVRSAQDELDKQELLLRTSYGVKE